MMYLSAATLVTITEHADSLSYIIGRCTRLSYLYSGSSLPAPDFLLFLSLPLLLLLISSLQSFLAASS